MTYEITSFDVCMAGFERLRNQDEFILVAGVWHGMKKSDLLQGFIDDIQCCDRPEGFNFQDVRIAVKDFVTSNVDMRSALRYIDPPQIDEDGEPLEADSDGPTAYLYVRQVA